MEVFKTIIMLGDDDRAIEQTRWFFNCIDLLE